MKNLRYKSMLKEKVNTKSIAFTLLLSYVVVLVLPIVASFIIMFQSVSVINEEVDNSKVQTLEFAKNSIDTRISEAERLAVQTAMNSDILSFMNTPFASGIDKNDKIFNLIKIVNNINLNNSFVDQCNLYFAKKDIYITKSSFFNKEMAYKALFGYYDISYAEWEKIIVSPQEGVVVQPMRQKDIWKYGGARIAVIMNMPVYETTISDGKVVLIMNDSHILDIFSNMSNSEKDTTYMLSSDNDIIANSDDFIKELGLKYETLKGDKGTIRIEHNHKKYNVLYVNSKEFDCKYITVTPVVTVSNQSMGIIIVSFLITLAAMACAIWVIISTMRGNRKEIHNLMDKVQAKIGTDYKKTADGENEFELIKNSLDKIVVITEKDRDIFYKQQTIINENVLQRMLRGRSTENMIYENPNDEVLFVSDMFAVIIYTIGDTSAFFDEEEIDDEEKFRVLKFIIKNVTEELINQEHKGYTIENDGFIVSIMNFKDKMDTNDAIKDMEEMCETAGTFFKERLQLDINAASGDIHAGVDGINHSYNEAMETVQYQKFTDADVYMRYSDIPTIGNEYYYSFETEKKLMNFIRAGENNRAKEFVRSILKESIEIKSVPVNVAHIMIFDIASTLLKAASEINEIGSIQSKDYVKKLFNDNTYADLTASSKNLDSMIDDVCSVIQSTEEMQHSNVLNDVNQYIYEHYQDSSLSVAKISAQFYFSSAYLSRMYKLQMGEGMLDVINKTRIKHALELLDTTNMSIEMIASKTGFTSSTVFIRVFKKYQGITPGKYKEMK